MIQAKKLSREQALQKLKHYCSYQERCHREVQQKLYDLGVWKKDHAKFMAVLIEENYLNVERFAIAYAGGKWRMKQWGRVKIKQALKLKHVSDYCIKKAMKQIDEAGYMDTLQHIAKEKYKTLKGEQYLLRKKKTIDHLLQKGFEIELIQKAIENLK